MSRPGTALRDLREERLADLIAREGHGDDDEHGGTREEPEPREPLDSGRPGRRAGARSRPRRLSHTANGASDSPCVRTRAASARTAGFGPKRLWTAKRHDQDEEEPEQRQRDVQVPGTWSTPVVARRLQPGGRCSVVWSCSTPVDQPTAGSAPVKASRESASSWSDEWRSSIPAAFVSGCAVTS